MLQTGVIDPGPGVATYFPAIDINKAGDIGLTYMETSPSEYISMYVTGQIKGDPAGTMRPAVLAQAGVAPYLGYRQGDFAGMSVDPVNDSFWAANEYAPDASQTGNFWGTWIQQFSLQPSAVTGVYLNLGNSGDGIQLNGVSGALIAGNTISANGGNGINADSGTTGLQVASNLIGTDPVGDNLGNVGNGINVLGSKNTISGNTITFNGVAGVLVGGSGRETRLTRI